jgi:hypothetical protein
VVLQGSNNCGTRFFGRQAFEQFVDTNVRWNENSEHGERERGRQETHEVPPALPPVKPQPE